MADLNAMLTPIELKQLGRKNLGIVWSDGHNAFYSVRELRLRCRCAHCVDEWTQEARLDPKSVPEDVHPKRIESVGRYALRVEWSDGHDTGIYPFPNLRRSCQCPACVKEASALGAQGAPSDVREEPRPSQP